jgi:putative ABC transport system permease protein
MALHNLRQHLRILLKEKRITFINITGLSISLACALFMLLWVEHELSYDRFHKDYRQLYRVEEDQYYTGEEPYHVNVTPYVSGPVWKEEVPEIIGQCRFAWRGGMLLSHGENRFFEDGIVAVDSSFFDMFSFEFKQGNAASCLRDPYTMVLTEEIATKYFGDGDPIGQVIQVDQEYTFTVSGVVKKLPRNTILGFDILIPWSFIQSNNMYTESWGTNSIRTYVKLHEGSVDSVVNRKITEVTDIYKENNTIDYMVAPLSGIHLHGYFGYGRSPGAVLYVYIFSAIALFVLLIACINFMNLSTARSSVRAKEIGLRKVNGASRGHLVRRHLFESFIQTLVSVILAFVLVMLLLNKFNQISGKEISLDGLFSAKYILGILGILIVTTFLAGVYPALFLSAMKPVRAIREQSGPRTGSGLLRKILVVFQFSLAVLLITGALVASRQLNYMRGADLGFNKSNLVHIQLRGNLNQEYEMLKEEFTRHPGVIAATASMEPPYQIGSNSGGIDWDGKDPEQTLLVSYTGVHYDFIKTMGIKLRSGRDFTSDFPGDMYNDTTANFIINETLAGIIGKEEVLGMDLEFMGIRGQIVGIMEDYHFQPLGNDIEPMALAPLPPQALRQMIVRLDPADPGSAMKFIEEKWGELLPQYPFESNYVSDVIDEMYMAEERMSGLLKIFTVVAIVIASLGLFALASFTAERRTREIGIRKTLGAMERQITLMMIRDFSLYIILSLVIALPAVWFIARWWLNEFSFRIDLKAGLFLLASLITVVVAILTVLYHAVRTARTNPVNALRYE